MNSDGVNILVGMGGLILTSIGTYLAVRSFYQQLVGAKQRQIQAMIDEKAAAATKAYAAQRDFEHLKRNQEQLKVGLTHLSGDLEKNEKLLLELSIKFNAVFHQVQRIAAKLDGGVSGGWTPPKE